MVAVKLVKIGRDGNERRDGWRRQVAEKEEENEEEEEADRRRLMSIRCKRMGDRK